MSYPITTTNSTKLFDLLDGTTNSNLGVTLIGRNYTNYGEFQNENFVRLLENFASEQDPSKNGAYTPLKGTLWYDTANARIRVYNGSQWVSVSERTVSQAAPTQNKLGDQWYSVTDKQLFSWDGNTWVVVGPAYSATQGLSGEIVETIKDIYGAPHTVISSYTNGNRIAITSFDSEFVPQTAIPHFGDILPGINLNNLVNLNGTAFNSLELGGAIAANYARTDITTPFAANVSIGANLRIGGTDISTSHTNLDIRNKTLLGNIDVYVTTINGLTQSLFISGLDGIPQMPIALTSGSSPNAVTNKNYVDQNVTVLNANIGTLAQTTTANLNTAVTRLTTNIGALRTDTNANLTSAVTSINANAATLSAALNSNVAIFSNNIATLQGNVVSINNTILTLAPLDSAQLTGTPIAPTAPLNSNNSIIASTAYVDITASGLSSNLGTQLAAIQTALTNALNNGLALKANINSQLLTGTPGAPTPPAGDNTTRLATTAFVTGAVAAQKFNYTVSPNPPSGGNNGDFWFQVG
jgi:hypothetical protein